MATREIRIWRQEILKARRSLFVGRLVDEPISTAATPATRSIRWGPRREALSALGERGSAVSRERGSRGASEAKPSRTIPQRLPQRAAREGEFTSPQRAGDLGGATQHPPARTGQRPTLGRERGARERDPREPPSPRPSPRRAGRGINRKFLELRAQKRGTSSCVGSI